MAEIWFPAVVIAALIVLNGIFVAAEFAIAGASRPAMERRAEDGNRLAGMVARTLGEPRRQDRYIATAQIGITAASLGLGMYGEHQLAVGIYALLSGPEALQWAASHAIAVVIAVGVLTYFHIVLGEMVPKALALQNAERTALWVSPPMLWIQRVLMPFVLLLNGMGNGVLRLMGIRRVEGEEQRYSPEELQYIVHESMEGGELEHEAARMLEEIFEFGDLHARDVMVARVNVQGIEVGATAEEVAAILRETRHTRYPVYEDDLDHIVGMMHVKDLLLRLSNGNAISAQDARPVPYAPETSSVEAVLQLMRQHRTQMVVILGELGGTSGIVTVEDLSEEIIGSIQEGFAQKAEMYRDAVGKLHVAGTVRLAELGQALGPELEHEDVETVSGLVLMLLDRPPEVGDVVTHEGFRVEVTSVAGMGVGECVITPAPDMEPGDTS